MLSSPPAVADIAHCEPKKGITMSPSATDNSSAIQRASENTLSGPQDRTAVRLKVEFLKCNLGSVVDLSLGGLRVLSWRRLRGRHLVKLYNAENGVRMEAEVRRCERVGFCKHQVGLEFVDVEPEAADALRVLATQGGI